MALNHLDFLLMKKIIITGFSGFVSYHFLEFLESEGTPVQVLGVDMLSPGFDFGNFEYVRCRFEKIDLLDKNQVDNLLYQFQPDYILHLASYSSVAFSWKDPVTSYRNNTNIFLNLLEQIRNLQLDCRVLSVGSSEEYGNVSEADIPLVENRQLDPVSPYGAARVSQEQLSRIYVEGFGLDVVMTRSFNHIGPRQRDTFAVASFARQIVEMSKSEEKVGELRAGDVSIIRDFLDVRDVVRAYYELFMEGQKGAVYNVCSGQGVSLSEIIQRLAAVAGVNVHIVKNDKLIRPMDNRIIIGSYEKIKQTTGWEPKIPLSQSLQDIVAYWNQQI